MPLINSDSRIKLYSRMLLLAGISNILGNFAGFLFGPLLIAAAALFHSARPRPIVTVAGSIAMTIAAFISIRTVISILYPTPILYAPFASAQALLMSASPIFTLIAGGSVLIPGSYSEAVAMADLVFNTAAVTLNFTGLGFLVWGWPELVRVQATPTAPRDDAGTSGLPKG